MQLEQISSSCEAVSHLLTDDGYLLQYRVWKRQEICHAMIVLLNGVMSHSGWFRTLAEKLAASNLCVVGADRRGSGLNKEDRGDIPSRLLLLSDLRAIVEREHPYDIPVYLAGWCWGGVLAVNAALELGTLFKGLILLAPGLFPSQIIIRAMEEEVRHASGSRFAPRYLRSPIQEQMFTDGPYLRDFILKDNLRLLTFTPRFHRITVGMGAVAVRHLVRLSQPVLLLLARRDITVDNSQTLDAFARVSAVTPMIFECQHGMQFEVPDLLATRIANWVDSVSSTS
jgi:alpha-beta hydrolase superfamily lysophospholipase